MQDLRTVRQERRLTQFDVSELTGLPQSHVHGLESGKFVPRDATRQKLESLLGVGDIDWLITAGADKQYITRMLLEMLNLQAEGVKERLLHVKKVLKVVEQQLTILQ